MMLFILIIIVTFAISLYAQGRVSGMYSHFSKVPSRSGYTGAQCAARILQAADIHDVEIVEQGGTLTDHYDPLHKRLVLSTENFHGTSLAALGISAHECGHAIQHKAAYSPLQWRMASVGVTGIANQMVFALPILGMLTGFGGGRLWLILMAVAWGIIMLFNLLTLPVEYDASNRARLILSKMNFTTSEEEDAGVKKMLDAAALTYLAAFITSLLYLLYYLLPLLLGRRD